VGAAYDYDYSNIDWSVQWQFTTSPVGGPTLPAPVVVGPAHGAVVTVETLLFDWQPLDGALEYDLTVHDIDEDSWFGIVGIYPPKTEIGPDQHAWIFDYTEGTHFRWRIKARNDYAWGNESRYLNFTLDRTYNIKIIRSKYDIRLERQLGVDGAWLVDFADR
jgi:hypothetical protein